MWIDEVNKIFEHHWLWDVNELKKIEIWFSNDIYEVNGKYILKVSRYWEYGNNLIIEAYFYKFFNGKIPLPNLIICDDSKNIVDGIFLIAEKIEWCNLYSKRHLYSDKTRKKIIKQISSILKIINGSLYDEFIEKFWIIDLSHKDQIIGNIKKYLVVLEERKVIDEKFIRAIRKYVEKYSECLEQQKMWLVYRDIHFDNILVKWDDVVWILDFEWLMVRSIDYVLDTARRMVRFPDKYMSSDFEKYAKKEDYDKLLTWYKNYYPELFDFRDLEKRIDLYSLEHDLNDLINWPEVDALKELIAETVWYNLH